MYKGDNFILECLDRDGWAYVPAISTQSQLLEVARRMGCPVETDDGYIVKELKPVGCSEAKRNTLSHRYGLACFPLHTDTAFWPEPCRFLLLRARGDIRRTTTVLSFASLFRLAGGGLKDLAERSIWIASTNKNKLYCSMRFTTSLGEGWRYDSTCMIPANRAARDARDELNRLVHADIGGRITWKKASAVVIDNWTCLHGRGGSPFGEGTRILERVYVRST